jgi:hypothetical protein
MKNNSKYEKSSYSKKMRNERVRILRNRSLDTVSSRYQSNIKLKEFIAFENLFNELLFFSDCQIS